MPLAHGPSDRKEGIKKNFNQFKKMREKVGNDFLLMADCWMALDIQYAVELAHAMTDLNLYWMEEVLHPDDFDGHKILKDRVPWMRWTSGEHEYTRYGFR